MDERTRHRRRARPRPDRECRPRRRATATNVRDDSARSRAEFLQALAGHLHRREHGHCHQLEGQHLHLPSRQRDAAVRIHAAGRLHPRDRPQQLRLRVRALGARRRAGQHLGGRRRHRHARQVQPRGPDADDDRPPRRSGRHAVEHAGHRPLTTAATRSTASAARPTSPSISRATSSSPTATSTAASSSTTRTAAS